MHAYIEGDRIVVGRHNIGAKYYNLKYHTTYDVRQRDAGSNIPFFFRRHRVILLAPFAQPPT